MPALR